MSAALSDSADSPPKAPATANESIALTTSSMLLPVSNKGIPKDLNTLVFVSTLVAVLREISYSWDCTLASSLVRPVTCAIELPMSVKLSEALAIVEFILTAANAPAMPTPRATKALFKLLTVLSILPTDLFSCAKSRLACALLLLTLISTPFMSFSLIKLPPMKFSNREKPSGAKFYGVSRPSLDNTCSIKSLGACLLCP